VRECLAGEKGKLLLKDVEDPSRRSAKWGLSGGASGDFGDPSVDTDYAWCVYDESAGVAALVLSAALPSDRICDGRPCWQAKKTGWLYKDSSAARDGVQKLLLKRNGDGQTVITLKARGENLLLPGLPLQQSPRVRVRLLAGNGACWESDLAEPAKKNEEGRFTDRLP
jgi:hypothetical protein